MRPSLRLAVDIGGTFTDGVLIEDRTDRTWTHKVLTTPDDPSDGFIEVMDRICEMAGCIPADLVSVTHATTITTNTLLQLRGAKTALLATAGFEDVLVIGRQIRHELYNLQTNKPTPLVPRERSIPIRERMDYRGEVLLELHEGDVRRAADRLVADGVESLAICFLHSYMNPAHERRAAAIVRSGQPGLHVSVSSEIAPQIKEFWRASTTVVNAYVAPVMDRYLGLVESKLATRGVRVPLHVMGSSGALMTARTARARPVDLVESGPAAGVSGAVRVAEAIGVRNAISFDMGGTTAKVGVILDGHERTLSEFEVGSPDGSGTAVAMASGYPILGSIVDLVEVGAGGGSIAWIDSGGHPRVGPQSAGARPGPACYGRGGTEPTVTDAHVVTGTIAPERFAEDVVALDVDAALLSVERLGVALGVAPDEAARGILEIAEAHMADAIRLVSVERGHDPRDFCLIAFGGAGPLHACRLAARLGIPTVVIPPNAGVLSALGMLLSDFRHEHRLTRLVPLDVASRATIDTLFDGLEADAFASLEADGIRPRDRALRRRLEVRYLGQSWTLTVAVERRRGAAVNVAAVRRRFDGLHERAYGYALPDEPVEIVTFAVVGVGLNRHRALRPPEALTGAMHVPAKEPVNREHGRGRNDPSGARRRQRDSLVVGDRVRGPAWIDERGSTTVVEPGYTAVATAEGMLVLTRDDAAARGRTGLAAAAVSG